MLINSLVKLQCKRCYHVWTPRKQEVRMCPKCKSPWWDKEKSKEPVTKI
jgi:Zn finger protein HypA/HybF involved in hydrogenase expression